MVQGRGGKNGDTIDQHDDDHKSFRGQHIPPLGKIPAGP